MRRGVNTKVPAVRPPPQAWLANCLYPTRVVTVSARMAGLPAQTSALPVHAAPGHKAGNGGEAAAAQPAAGLGEGVQGGGGSSGAAPKDGGGVVGGRGERGAKRGRGEGSGAKFEVAEQDGSIWVQCDSCSKWYIRERSCRDFVVSLSREALPLTRCLTRIRAPANPPPPPAHPEP
jgi:hypothetical protein